MKCIGLKMLHKLLSVVMVLQITVLAMILRTNAKHITQLEENASEWQQQLLERQRIANASYPALIYDEPLGNEDNDIKYSYEVTSYDGNNNDKRSSRLSIYGRGCIRRAGACDHRPNDCCFNSSCRCNLWGTNCRCQRMGLFQKWG